MEQIVDLTRNDFVLFGHFLVKNYKKINEVPKKVSEWFLNQKVISPPFWHISVWASFEKFSNILQIAFNIFLSKQ